MTERPSSNAISLQSSVTAIALVLLACAIGYLGWVLNQYRQQLPTLLSQADQTAARLDPAIEEVAQIRRLIPDIQRQLEQIQSQIPAILEESAAIRAQIPDLLQEVSATREQIPPILQEIAATRQQVPAILKEVTATRKQLPNVLKSVDGVAESAQLIAQEVQLTRPLIPDIIQEIALTRESIPVALDRAEGLITQARSAGKEASKGAVTGVISGVISAPLDLVGGLGKRLVQFTDSESVQLSSSDIRLIEHHTQILLDQDRPKQNESWDNSATKRSGKIKHLGQAPNHGQDCRLLKYETFAGSKRILDKEAVLCQQSNGSWKLSNQ